MKRGSRVLLFLLVVIIILVGVAFFVIQRGILPGSQAVTQTPSPMVNIVVVAQPINRDSQIKKESLGTMPFAQANVTSKMVTDPNQVIGKYATFPLAQGLPLTTDMVADRPGLSQPGSDAVALRCCTSNFTPSPTSSTTDPTRRWCRRRPAAAPWVLKNRPKAQPANNPCNAPEAPAYRVHWGSSASATATPP